MRHISHFLPSGGLKWSFPLAAAMTIASPALAHDTATEAANKKVVLSFYQALNDADATGTTKARIQGIAETYISPAYVQHAESFANLPGPGSARDKLVRMFQSMPPMKQPPSRTVEVMAESDMVMLLTARDMPDPAGGTKPAYIFNMFRVKDGRLAEHWSIVPPPPGMGGPAMPPPGATPPGTAPSSPVPPPQNPQ